MQSGRDTIAVKTELACQNGFAKGSDNAGFGQQRSSPGVTTDPNSTDKEHL
jgi:hypothetical protein